MREDAGLIGWIVGILLLAAACTALFVAAWDHHPRTDCPRGTHLAVVRYGLVGKILVPEYGCEIN